MIIWANRRYGGDQYLTRGVVWTDSAASEPSQQQVMINSYTSIGIREELGRPGETIIEIRVANPWQRS